MSKISVKLSDELLAYLDQKVSNRNDLIEKLLVQWKSQLEDEELAQACAIVDQLGLGWQEEWQQAAIIDWEVSG